ncbi:MULTISPECIES: single-stranded DNA-binding protein [unclassified Pseudoxanthomonas]|uniref:single-stranded DNA-binding protein n=1 Tax=unclassified Pseudoxanthomonas TaxID=2645906 RepID=UPI00307E4058
MSQIVIEIFDIAISTKTGKSKATGQPYTLHQQEGYIHNGHRFPERFVLTPPMVDDKPVAYPVGKYVICPSSFKVSEYGELELGRYEFKLLRLEEKLAAKAA